jgi:hypothetical protein
MFAAFLSSAFSNCPNYVQPSGATLFISDTLFQGCMSAVNSSACDACTTITACVFSSCWSPSNGGGIDFLGTQIETFRSSFTDCSAEDTGAAIKAFKCWDAIQTQWSFTDNLVMRARCWTAPVFWTAAFQSWPPYIAVTRTNFTLGSVTETSTVASDKSELLYVAFCQFEWNLGTNCASFEVGAGSSEVGCLRFLDNVCGDGDTLRKGLIWIYPSCTISDSVFENNGYLWIVGKSSTLVTPTLTFRNCYFDAFVESAYGGALFTRDGCQIGGENHLISASCVEQTQLKSMSPPGRTSGSNAVPPPEEISAPEPTGKPPHIGRGAITVIVLSILLYGLMVVNLIWRAVKPKARVEMKEITNPKPPPFPPGAGRVSV